MFKIKENIYSVGVIDSKVRVFHGYQTPIGTTYNAYLIIDEQVTLIDFVKVAFAQELLNNIQEILGDRLIDKIICNHVEPDHSGALPLIVNAYPKALMYGTANCLKELKAYYPDSAYDFEVVKLGDQLNTGLYTFDFIPMPMVHWPDSMSTLLIEEGILFSNDAFGQHIGRGEHYDHQITEEELLSLAANYYANIVLPFGMQVIKYASTLGEYQFKMVCPSHGVILQEKLGLIVDKYLAWSSNVVRDDLVVIVYGTMWGTTAKLANCLAKEYQDKGLKVELINLSEQHYSYAMGRLLEAKYIFVGCPTLNNGLLPIVAAFLTYMKGLKPKNRIGQAFGSYGWSGESVGIVQGYLVDLGFEVLEPIKVQWNCDC